MAEKNLFNTLSSYKKKEQSICMFQLKIKWTIKNIAYHFSSIYFLTIFDTRFQFFSIFLLFLMSIVSLFFFPSSFFSFSFCAFNFRYFYLFYFLNVFDRPISSYFFVVIFLKYVCLCRGLGKIMYLRKRFNLFIILSLF